ncbi:unnamed protein product [Larinioides sclopetarius]|uniref:Uncharacterized protein n=1 Tax=Larinioides sclopetarius TaxID=280406 RepID=A0AAV2AYB2_9ARAC
MRSMKSYSRPGKKSKTYSKSIVSIKLSDVQHLEKLGIRKCFVELKRLKPDDYGLSKISSSSPNIEKKPIAKNKLKNPNKKPRDRSKRIHLESEIIKNGTQTLHYETLENPTDHMQLQERKGQEQAKESNPTEADLAKKRKTGSFFNLDTETQNLDFESSEVRVTDHEVSKEIKLIDRGKKRKNKSGNFSNTSKETLNSATVLESHQEEQKIDQKQTRRKKKNRTSIESKREGQNLDFECSETVLSSLGQTEKSNLTEIELSKKNNTESSSTSNRETQNFDSENAEEMLAGHEKPDEKSQVETQKGKRKKNKSSDSNSGTHNLDSECSETQSLDFESSDVKLTDRKEIKLIDRGKRRNNRSGHSSDTSKETLNTVSECSETILEIHEEKKVSQKQTRKKKKNRTSFDSKREVQNLDFECSETVLESTVSSPCQLGESSLAETDLSKKNKTEISCSSYSKTQNFHSENSDGTFADEGSQVETNKRKWKTNRSSSDSNSETCNLDSECSESVLASHKGADENSNIQIGRQKKNRSVSNSSRETQNFDSESLETVLSKRHLCSEEMLPKPEHLKNSSKTKTRSRLKKCNTSSSDSNRETWNSDSEATETILINSEQTDDSSLRETELPRKSRSRRASNSNSETLNFNSGCSKTVPAGHKQTETVKAALLRKNRIRSSSTSSCGSQNVSSECSETVLPSCKQAEESNLTEIHLLRKAITRNSCIEGEMLESECKEILDHHEQPEEVRQAAAKRKKNIISSKLKKGILDLDPEPSESAPISHQKAGKINHVQTRSRKRNRSPSDSSRETQTVDSVCPETIIVNHEQGVENSLIEIDLLKNRSPSCASRGTENSFSECLEAIFTNDEQIGEICLTSSTVGRRNRSGSYSNSSEGTQSLNSEYSENILASSEQAERKNIISYKSKKRILNLDPESSESAPIRHQKAEKINHVQTRSRKRNRSPSDSSRETQNVDSVFSETIIVNHEQGVESSLIEIDLIENTVPSGLSRRTENSGSGCSEAILTSAEQIGEICLTSTTVGRRNRTGSSSNSSQGTQSLNSEYSETMLARSEQTEVSSLTETDLSNKKRSRSSDSSKEIQNLDSEFSGEPDSSTHVQSAILMSQVNLPVIKRVRNSSNPSNCLPQVQSSHFEEKDDEQLSQALKEKKKHINYAPVQKTNKKKSIFPTPRITRNSSNLNRNKNFHSALSKKHTGHRQTQKIKPIHQSNLLAKKRFQNNAQISHLEYSEEHLEPEQTQDFFLDSHLSTKKKAKKSLNNSFQNSDSESSEKHNEILQTQEFSLDSNLSSKTESRSPFSSSSMVQPSDFPEKQNEHMQTNDSNQPEEDLCVKKSNSVSDLDNKIVESVLEFSKQNGIEDNIEEQEKPENLIGSDSLAQEKIKTFYSSNEKISTLNSENNYVKNYPAENAKQAFSVANFSLNSKCENSASEHLEKENFENELERNIYHTHLEDVVQQSISQNTARTSLCASNQTNLLDSEILKSTDIEKDIEVQRDLLEKQGECFTENNVSVQNTVAQETCVDYENSEFGFSLVDGADKEMENLEKPVETLGNLPNYETHVQSRSRAADSNIQYSELNVDENNFEKQDHDIESPITSEEESDFSDAALLKKYGIKECSVVLTRAKPFIIHYGRPFLKEVAQVEYRSNRKTKHPNLDGLFRRIRLSQFSSLSKETFKREIKNRLQRLHLRDEFISKRLELINSDEAQLIEYKENYKRKIFYDKSNNGFVIVNENLIQEKRKALRNELFSYPLVLIERNEEAEFLVRKYMKRMNIELNRIGKEEVLDYNDYRETNQYSEGDESGNESDQSDNEETNLNADHNDDYVLQSYTRRPKDSLKEGKELQDSNLDCKESHIDRQKPFIDMQPDLETGMMQNYEDATNCVNSKSCESLQNQNLSDLNSTLESDHHFNLALHSDRSKEGIKESPWPQVLLRPVKRTTENDQAKSPSPALSEVDFIPFQQPGDSEQTNATNVLKEVAYNESTSECNPPSSGRETPLSMDHFDDAGEKKSFGTASEEFVVIDEDDDDSEKKSCCSFSEEGSEPDQQLCTTECQGSHQNSSLCPS